MDQPLLDRRAMLGATGAALGLAALPGLPVDPAFAARSATATSSWSPMAYPDCDAWFDASQTDVGSYAVEHFRGGRNAADSLHRTGALAMTRRGARMRAGTAATALTAPVRTPDYAVHMTATLAADGAAPILYPHVRDDDDHLAVRFLAGAGGSSIRVVSTTAGRARLLASTRTTGLTAGGVHRLRVEGRGGRYRVYVDGRHRLTARDTSRTVASGTRAGFGFGDGDTATRVAGFGVGTAKLATLRDGDRVTNLTNLVDPAGGDYAATTDPAVAPVFDATGLAGRPAIRFTGSERLGSPLTASPGAATWVAVIQQDAIRAGSVLGTASTGAPDGFELRINADGTVTGFRSGVWQIGTSTGAIVPGRPNIVAFLWDSTGSWAVSVNGEVSGFGYGGWRFHNAMPTNLAIGTSAPAGVGAFTGLVGEVVRWRRALRGSELREVHDRLAAKWGATLAPRIAAVTPAPFTARRLRGSNLSPKLDMYVGGGSVWTTFWRDWNWSWVKSCIDRAQQAGSDSIRIIGDVAAVAAGAIPQATYDARQQQVIDYLAAKGMRYYPCGFDLHGCPDLPAERIGAALASTARLHARNRRTVVGFDLINELATNYNSYGREKALDLTVALARAVRAAAPGLPLSVSDPGDLNWGVLSRGTPLDVYKRLAPHVDFFDVHAYVGTKLRPWHLLPYEMSVGRPMVIGEFGEDVHDNGDTVGAAYYRSVRSMRTASASVAGVFQWAVVEDTCGLWAETGDEVRPLTLAEWKLF